MFVYIDSLSPMKKVLKRRNRGHFHKHTQTNTQSDGYNRKFRTSFVVFFFRMLEWKAAPPETELFGESVPPRFIKGLENEGPDVPKKRWMETRNWRESAKIDTILEEPQPRYEDIKRLYQHGYCGHAKDGRIVYYERPEPAAMEKMKELGIDSDVQVSKIINTRIKTKRNETKQNKEMHVVDWPCVDVV